MFRRLISEPVYCLELSIQSSSVPVYKFELSEQLILETVLSIGVVPTISCGVWLEMELSEHLASSDVYQLQVSGQ